MSGFTLRSPAAMHARLSLPSRQTALRAALAACALAGPVVLDIGRVLSIEKDKKPVDELRKGQQAAVKVDIPTSVTFGRHFTAQNLLYSRVTRESIDALKEHFKDDLSKEEWQLVIKLKRIFGIL
jgi:hypothetical protein